MIQNGTIIDGLGNPSFTGDLLIKNGKIEKEWDVDTYEKSYVMRYFGIEKLEEKKSGGLQLELQSGGSPW